MNIRSITFSIILFISCIFIQAQNRDLGNEYIEAWKQFYPSKALAQGFHPSIFHFEILSKDRINEWLTFNKKIQQQLSNSDDSYVQNHPIDARLLKVQVQREVDLWEKEVPQKHSLSLYTSLLSKAASSVLDAEFLNPKDKQRIICTRLTRVQNLCTSAQESLEDASIQDVKRGVSTLQKLILFYEDELKTHFSQEQWSANCGDFETNRREASSSLRSLLQFVENKLQPQATNSSPILGREEYARRLHLYTDSPLTPEELAKMVEEEISTTRKLILEVSEAYLKETYPQKAMPSSEVETIKWAFNDMENDAPKNGAEYLTFWQDLSASAISFIEKHQIATLPKYQTLRIMPAPESAGAAARIGWVASAPPFAPNPVTTLYLPSIPETMPEQERIDFWSSFNKPFNRMIVIHELFPGHYMQIKVSRESAHPIRLLFPYGPYIEGWATFTERVLLDAGWEEENKLTMLAHLRKRLENANRAYMSVQVHCQGWNQEQVMKFSTDTSLLAPQFAKSLWGRLMRSPMQITSYFLGGSQFMNLFEKEKKRLGDEFVLQTFMDTILRSGPIPVDEFPSIFH